MIGSAAEWNASPQANPAGWFAIDAVKIGLTATPAAHTVAIVGDPIFTYTYRRAVIDG